MFIFLQFKKCYKIIYAYYLDNVKEYCCRMGNSFEWTIYGWRIQGKKI